MASRTHRPGRCRDRGLLNTVRGQQRTDSTHVLANVRALTRVEVVGETMRHALHALALVAPDWLVAHSPPEWVERWAHRLEDNRLPTANAAREALAVTIGADGAALLKAVFAEAPAWLREGPAVELLWRVWVQHSCSTKAGTVAWRTDAAGSPPASQVISAPHDPDAHFARTRTTMWVGYTVHLTETGAT